MRYAPRLRHVVRRRLADRELVDDVVQETFLRVHRAFDSFDQSKPFWPWLDTIATNVCIDLSRRAASRPEVPMPLDEPALLPTGAVLSPERSVLQDEMRKTVADVMSRLEPHQRRVLVLREIEGRSYAEIATDEGLSLSAVKSAILRARRTFRDLYERLGGERGLDVVTWPVLVGRWRRARAWLRRHRSSDPWTMLGPLPVTMAESVMPMILTVTLAVATLSSHRAPTRPAREKAAGSVQAVPALATVDTTVRTAERGVRTGPVPDRRRIEVRFSPALPPGVPSAEARSESSVEQGSNIRILRHGEVSIAERRVIEASGGKEIPCDGSETLSAAHRTVCHAYGAVNESHGSPTPTS